MVDVIWMMRWDYIRGDGGRSHFAILLESCKYSAGSPLALCEATMNLHDTIERSLSIAGVCESRFSLWLFPAVCQAHKSSHIKFRGI
jgi:hypothetical protein